MANKFGRNYILTIDKIITPPLADKTLIVKPPFTMEFDITRRYSSSQSVGTVKVYNLSVDNRNSILKPEYDGNLNRNITLSAGYGDVVREILAGNIWQCTAHRDGVNWVSTIESYDGGNVYTNSAINITFPSNTSFLQIIMELAQAIIKFDPNIYIKFIDEKSFSRLGSTRRSWVCSGNAMDRIKDIVGENAVYIDNMGLVVKNVSTPIAVSLETPVISFESGLLGTPSIEGNYMTFSMIFEPSLSVGQSVNLQSVAGFPESYSGIKIITELHHQGTISDAVCGDAVTTITTYAPGAPRVQGV